MSEAQGPQVGEVVRLRDESGRLTHAGMRAAINAGGSVSYKQRIISTHASLPTPEQLAETPEEKAAAVEDIDGQIKALQARKASMKQADKQPPQDDKE